MLRLALLVGLMATLLACSTHSRQTWGEALIGASDYMRNSRTVYCTTSSRRSGTSTYCY